MVADFPADLTNGELLTLARTWRRQALECNADKAAIEEWAKQGADQARNNPAPESR